MNTFIQINTYICILDMSVYICLYFRYINENVTWYIHNSTLYQFPKVCLEIPIRYFDWILKKRMICQMLYYFSSNKCNEIHSKLM